MTSEFSNFFRQAADEYLQAYIDMATRLDAEWIVVHAGFHFTTDYEQRKQASLERLQQASSYAEDKGVHLLLENMIKSNWFTIILKMLPLKLLKQNNFCHLHQFQEVKKFHQIIFLNLLKLK